MNPFTISFHYRFHSAGQGIFASGTLASNPTDRFHWVFDCGSTSLDEVLRPVVARYRSLVVWNQLDLLCISHFDNDHVSGLTDLLAGLHIQTVVIPYYSKVERLVFGARKLNASSDYIAFLSDPIIFILERAASVGQIIVLGGGGEGDLRLPGQPIDEPGGEGGGGNDERRRESSWRFKPVSGEPLNPEAVVDAETMQMARRLNTPILAFRGSMAAIASCYQLVAGWEFLFFHKPLPTQVLKSLSARLRRALPVSLAPGSGLNLSDLLQLKRVRQKVRAVYEQALPRGEDVNSTSLCVYTGPELEKFNGAWITRPWPDQLMGMAQSGECWHDSPSTCSALYTGDANLKPRSNRDELQEYITPERWSHIMVLQVPHHGSRNNWEAGASQEFCNSVSVFCADENHKKFKHPHREVVIDLMNRGPLLANKNLSWTMGGRAHFSD